MDTQWSSRRYCGDAVVPALLTIHDIDLGQNLDFCRLFFPSRVGEGYLAFENYVSQVSKAQEAVPLSSSELVLQIQEQLKKHGSRQPGADSPDGAAGAPPFREAGGKGPDSSNLLPDALQEDSPFMDPLTGIHENRLLSEEIRKRIQARTGEAPEGPVSRAPENFLRQDQTAADQPLLLHRSGSRVLLLASAGSGKTTLLQRLALLFARLYLDRIVKDPDDRELVKTYSLPASRDGKSFVPCLIRLRRQAGSLDSIPRAMAESIAETMESAVGGDSLLDAADLVARWLRSEVDIPLLLIDGLDELDAPRRARFLDALGEYLSAYPDHPVILTSRVAGLSEADTEQRLVDLAFHGRSILPLTDEDVRAYTRGWIGITQEDPAIRRELLTALAQIEQQPKYGYLRDLMKTPLDLVTILKRLSGGGLSLNRWDMFYDLFAEKITRHTPLTQKSGVLEDTLLILSFLAYQMQVRGTLSVNQLDIGGFFDQLAAFSYKTAVLENESPDDVIALLEETAASSGLIEKDDSSLDIAYTFPIRTHQEFLAAYACCKLALSDGFKPDPVGVLSGHIKDSMWTGVVCFALAFLDSSSGVDFDRLSDMVFTGLASQTTYSTVIDSDFRIGSRTAELICRRQFAYPVLLPRERDMLSACLQSRSLAVYHVSLKKLYLAAQAAGSQAYLEAFAMANIAWAIHSEQNPQALAGDLLDAPKTAPAGARMLSLLVKIHLEEAYTGFVFKEAASPRASAALVGALRRAALETGDPAFVCALSELWIACPEDSAIIAAALDGEMKAILLMGIERLLTPGQQISLMVTPRQAPLAHEYAHLRELFQALGSLPPDKGMFENKTGKPYLSAILAELYRKARGKSDMDQIAILLAASAYHPDWTRQETFVSWRDHLCLGKSAAIFRPSAALWPRRMMLHFALVQPFMIGLEHQFKSPTALFDEGDYLAAAQKAIHDLVANKEASRNNLAFLLRYGELEPGQLDAPFPLDIPSLLHKEVYGEKTSPFATLNLALYWNGRQESARAKALLLRLSNTDWRKLTTDFWYPSLWVALSGDPEGALVCVLAARLGGQSFKEISEMSAVAWRRYPELLQLFEESA